MRRTIAERGRTGGAACRPASTAQTPNAARGKPLRRASLWLVLLPGLALATGTALGQAPEDPTDSLETLDPEPLDAGAPPASEDSEQTLPVTRFEAELAFDRMRAAGDHDAAIAVGERMVELTIDEFGAESVEAGDAYAALGAAQREVGDFDAAEESYLRSVEIMRETEGTYSEHLIDPLLGLGDTYHADDEHLNAVSAYNEARSVNRRVFGLLNEDQIPILDRMTESFYAMDEFEQAEEQQLAALRLVERVHEPESSETLEAIYKYADWLRRNNRFSEEREHYVRALRRIREHYGDGDARLVEPLRRTGNSYRRQRLAHGQGIGSLTEALEILRAQDDPDRLQMAEVLRDIGDWNTAFSNTSPDHAEYREAWELLGEVDDGERLREDWFGGVRYVLREPYSSRGLSRDPDAVQGSVVVRLDITESGRSENVAVVESDPPGFNEASFVRQVSRSRFRPHMTGGVVVPARRLGLRFTFMYLPDELDDED